MHFLQVERKPLAGEERDITQAISESKTDIQHTHSVRCCAATAPASQEHCVGDRRHKHFRT